MGDVWVELVIILLLILANGVFAMSEISVVTSRKVRLQQRSEEGDHRARLASIVFADSEARRDLEAIVHPGVYRGITAGLRAFELIGESRLAVVDVPLLYESGHAGDFDHVIVTDCPEEVQLMRLRERGVADVEARQRIGAQWPNKEKAARATFVIHTGGTFQETDRQVDEVLSLLSGERTAGSG